MIIEEKRERARRQKYPTLFESPKHFILIYENLTFTM